MLIKDTFAESRDSRRVKGKQLITGVLCWQGIFTLLIWPFGAQCQLVGVVVLVLRGDQVVADVGDALATRSIASGNARIVQIGLETARPLFFIFANFCRGNCNN